MFVFHIIFSFINHKIEARIDFIIGGYNYTQKEIKVQIDIDFLINNQTSVKFYCTVIVFEARIDFKLGQYVYPQREIKAQITSNSYSSTIEIKPCYSSSVNRNDFLHDFLEVCLHS